MKPGQWADPLRGALAVALASIASGASVAGAFSFRLGCGRVNSSDPDPSAGLLLVGGAEAGGAGEPAATAWFLQRAGGGDYLVLRSGGLGSQAAWVCADSGGSVASAAELSVDTRAAANDPQVVQHVVDAEAVFIAGGDQRAYVELWRDTALEDALNTHLQAAPIGGTSAGMAVLASSYYAPTGPGVLSSEILNDPYHPSTDAIGYGDFLLQPLLDATITDTHLDRAHGAGDENRYGRLFALLARSVADREGQLPAFAIGAEEGAFLGVEASGMAQAFGNGSDPGADVYLLQSNAAGPESIVPGMPLVWQRDGLAVKAYRMAGTPDGSGSFDLGDWLTATGGEWLDWYTDGGYTGFNYAGGECGDCSGAAPPQRLILRDGFELSPPW